MSDYISKSALIEQLIEWANRNEMMGYLTSLDIVRECIGVVENQPTVDEKEIIRKPMERILTMLEDKSNDIPIQYENNYEKGVTDGIDYAMQIVEKEGGIE